MHSVYKVSIDIAYRGSYLYMTISTSLFSQGDFFMNKFGE